MTADGAAFTVRRGAAGDAAVLAAFMARTFQETFGAQNSPEDIAAHAARSYGASQQARELASPDVITLLMEQGTQLAAFAQVRRGEAPPCVTGPSPVELHRFYVDAPWHGSGAARQLMGEVLGAARALGGRTLWLGVWERNPRAIRFYEKCGFTIAGTQDYFVGSDRQYDRVMVAALPPNA
ncbi:MAG TPA: GNAT family N-acetyltransferase [Gemmatimonadaceae bacterium]|nr:GNAT family N-acetyltransferase [Gemmatimonadaceae bacterium]